MRTRAIVNPTAGGGRARRVWPRLLPRLQEVTNSLSVRRTTGPGTATSFTRQALKDGVDRILAVGGDGTLHEVVNGFFEDGSLIQPSAVLVFIPCGSGSDFRRTLEAPSGLNAVQQLQSSRIRPLDLLRVQYTTATGKRENRYAINIASAGLSGTVVRHLGPGVVPFPPRLRYFGAALRALASDRPTRIRLTIDGESLPPTRVRLVAAANGHTFAAGLPIAPSATPFDGLLDVVVLGDLPVRTLLLRAYRFYQGTHLDLDGVETLRGRRLTITSPDKERPMWTEADGEALGRLPMTVEVVPQVLRVQY